MNEVDGPKVYEAAAELLRVEGQRARLLNPYYKEAGVNVIGIETDARELLVGAAVVRAAYMVHPGIRSDDAWALVPMRIVEISERLWDGAVYF